MESVTLENFRCFREKQTVKLAPLTLLVGENSTGKTSFLALVDLLARLAEGEIFPDFKRPPYDLGSFSEIAHARAGREGKAQAFSGGLTTTVRRFTGQQQAELQSSITNVFEKRGSAPAVVRRMVDWPGVRVCEEAHPDGTYVARLEHAGDSWELLDASEFFTRDTLHDRGGRVRVLLLEAGISLDQGFGCRFVPLNKGPDMTSSIARTIESIYSSTLKSTGWIPFSSAPIRSLPLRTYNPAAALQDPQGAYIPMYLADLARENTDEWQGLKTEIETFGKRSALFDELRVRLLGSGDSDPFQLQVRKGSRRLKGPYRNLIDVGYGVSQVLPLIVEILRQDGARQFLLQQPELHLHPTAQAALGSLFCEVAAGGRQLIVETHSDHLIDRIRMDVRDGKTSLKPEDVRILYFERSALDVHIHEINFDEQGNICGAPETYRSFFMDEVRRSLGL